MKIACFVEKRRGFGHPFLSMGQSRGYFALSHLNQTHDQALPIDPEVAKRMTSKKEKPSTAIRERPSSKSWDASEVSFGIQPPLPVAHGGGKTVIFSELAIHP